MKISILWSSLASYTVAFFKELAHSHDCSIQLFYFGAISEAPYEYFDLSFCSMATNRSNSYDIDILEAVYNFYPDCILMCSWNFMDYMKIAKRMRRRGTFVVSIIDHQWEGTIKQWLGVFSSRWFLKPSIDCFAVTGDRQAYFAQKLGFEHILHGIYAAAVDDFKSSVPLQNRNPSFLFVGRLAPEKGIENLIRAYRMYRKECDSPWDLKIAGTGEMKSLFSGIKGIETYGFIQPSDLPDLMHSARTFILPSLWEPWGVVIHEAAAAGLPIIATNVCGAVTAFLRDGVNGFIVQPKASAIKDAMLKITCFDSDSIERFGRASQILAELWTPRSLAGYFIENLKFAFNRTSRSENKISNIGIDNNDRL